MYAAGGSTRRFSRQSPPEKHPRHPLHNLPAIIPPRAPMLRAWEVNGMDDFWELFCQTGAPEAYMLYRAAQEENACSKQKP